MMQQEGQIPLQSFLEDLFEKQKTDPLQKLRTKAWERFLEIGLPDRKKEAFKYVKLRHLLDQSHQILHPNEVAVDQIQPFICPESRESLIVFVNGSYKPHLSNLKALPKSLIVMPLQEAITSYGALLTNQWVKAMKDEQDPFVAINGAVHQDGLFIYLPPKCIVEAPIQILNLVNDGQGIPFITPRVEFFAGAFSKAKLGLTDGLLKGTNFTSNKMINLNLEEEANIHVTQASIHDISEGFHLSALRAQLKKKSSLNTVHLTNGSTTNRYDYYVSLNGEECEALLHGICHLDGNRESHTHVLMEHQAPNCMSNQLFKGVLAGSSRSSFEGKILVRKPAQKTMAYQMNNHLLLSDHATAYSKPNLEIFADDVKASHGSTVGQLNEDHLFYLKTRGLSDQAAKKLLIDGFSQEVIDLVPFPTLAKHFSERSKY